MVTLAEQWQAAVGKLRVRHADREAVPVFEILPTEPPQLFVHVRNTRDTVTDARMTDLAVSTVTLTYWPGETVALCWLAAAWMGYVAHEALELATLEDGSRPLDPHASHILFDMCLRSGLPVTLTPEAIVDTLSLAMPRAVAERVARGEL